MFPDLRRRRPRFEFPGSAGAGPRQSSYLKNKQQVLKLTNNIQYGVDQLFFLNRLVNKNFVDEVTNNFTSKVLLDSIRFFLERNQNYARVIHECIVTQSCPTLCNHMNCSPPRSSVHEVFQARILECCHTLLQGIFPTQRLNPCLLPWHVDSLPLCHLGSPYMGRNKWQKRQAQ